MSTKPNICYSDYHYNKNGDFLKDDYTMIYINIPVNQINTFKSQLMALDKKYKEWIGVAAENNVTNIEKEIPISLSTFSNISGSVVTSPQEKTITPIFRIDEGEICCFIKIKLVENGVQQRCWWRLISADLHKIINEADIIIARQNERKQTEDLFH